MAVLAVANATSSANRRLLGGLVVDLSVGDAGARIAVAETSLEGSALFR